MRCLWPSPASQTHLLHRHHRHLSGIFPSKMASLSSSCSASSLRLVPYERTLFSLHPSKTLISPPLKPPEFPSFRRTIVTFQSIPTGISLSVSASSSPSSSVELQPIEELPPKLQEIVKLFQSVQQPKAKYEQLLFYGKNLTPLDAQFKTRENKVQGCVSQVWVRAFLDEEHNVMFEADSDSVLTKGLAALLVQGLSGRPVPEILRVTPDFAVLLGLQQSLTPSRNNGFLNMLKLMQKKALQVAVEAEENKGSTREADNGKETVLDSDSGYKASEHVELGSDKIQNPENGTNSGDLGNRGMMIKDKLERELNPVELEVEDVSYQHAGHAAVRGSGDGETHFNLRIVSDAFKGKSLVKRHRLIYDMLQDEFQNGLHALSIVAKTPAEV
ncbi:PREDICTED: sufE-like protein 1, chloroplastic/mitochondrial [Tarenaya hassleriana]|uniref:sufE-like protein 1, chloroplastic/mitochondrial n=1 Tax=Tarenaya hassleriana TaxID=28532 RepID=UPI00053C3840|nr:PREDICTED: sufE-like protein 1, chloroplastic/mitochondrial [Tarenaya hassleriana]